MEEDPPVMESLPEQPLTEAHIKEIGESDTVIGAMPFPEEKGIRGFILEHEDSFNAIIFDHRTETWRNLNQYSKDEVTIETVLSRAIDDRAEWYADTGRLDEL